MSIEDDFPPEEAFSFDKQLADAYTRLRARAVEMERAQQWRPIAEAPKGGGADRTDDPNWVDPPKLMLAFECGDVAICYFDYYYAPGGCGNTGLLGWVENGSGEEAERIHGKPTHFRPLPPAP